jgi:hypothetical protein
MKKLIFILLIIAGCTGSKDYCCVEWVNEIPGDTIIMQDLPVTNQYEVSRGQYWSVHAINDTLTIKCIIE